MAPTKHLWSRPQLNDRDFERVCLAASDARNRLWGYHRTLDRDGFQRVVADGARTLGLRAAVIATLGAVGIEVPDSAKAAILEASRQEQDRETA